MGARGRNILVTGIPGVGKTTLVKSLCKTLAARRCAGFYTGEIRDGSVRKGFEIVTLDGRRGILAHANNRSPFRVGRYGVDVRGFEALLAGIPFLDRGTDIVVIDEIGRMECFSRAFKELVISVMDAPVPLVATIALRGGGFIADIKMRRDITLLEMTRGNRDEVLQRVLSLLTPKPRGAAAPPPSEVTGGT